MVLRSPAVGGWIHRCQCGAPTCRADYIRRIPPGRIRWNGWPFGPVRTGPPGGGVGGRDPPAGTSVRGGRIR
ncbi:hypothetical protein ACFFX0_07185 [Citricoccus parietis]|uniref:Post-SET domain-containing protein n=1 Tax=Citricoccus parietis TaxID=592307 RepID=A0ABV5FWE8_9MICC